MEDTRNWVQSKNTNIEIPNLFPEIIEEMLKRLPVKSLLKFRCVSKSWLSLISSPQFMKTHLNFSTTKPNFTNQRIIHIIRDPNFNIDLKHTSVYSLLPEHEISVASDIDFPTKGLEHRSFWVVGCCNGVNCLAVDGFDIFLWNPSLRTSKKLPPLSVDTKEWFNYTWALLKVGSRNCLSIRGDVWVLKQESWSKVFSIPYVNDPNSKIYYSNPLLVLPSTGEVFLELAEWCGVVINKYITVYNPKDKSFRRPEIINRSVAVDM